MASLITSLVGLVTNLQARLALKAARKSVQAVCFLILLPSFALGQGRVMYVPGSSQRICQLTGETDIEFKTPTPNQTETNFGLIGTDLGASFEHEGAVWFLFGDGRAVFTNPPYHPKQKDDRDTIARSTDINADTGVHLQFVTEPSDPHLYRPPKVDGYPIGVPPIGHGGFRVPVHGFSGGQCPNQAPKMYVFFGSLVDDARHHPPVHRRSILAYSCDSAQTFRYVTDISTDKFIDVSVVIINNADWPYVPSSSGKGLLIFGTGDYGKSPPFLAWAPLASAEDVTTWQYFTGLDPAGHPKWRPNDESEALSLFDGLPNFNDPGNGGPCMRELSVNWNMFLKKWLMLYNCDGRPRGIRFQYADQPWGPWSDIEADGPFRTLVFDLDDDHGFGSFIHADREVSPRVHCNSYVDCSPEPGRIVGCAPAYGPAPQPDVCHSAADDQLWDGVLQIGGNPAPGPPRYFSNGAGYGPYMVSRYTKGDRYSTTIYYTMSTWNPYQAMLIKSTLKLERLVNALSPAHLWVGLKNSDDQGTQFDLKTELLVNGTPVASGLQRCVTGVTRNPTGAKEVVASFDSFPSRSVASGDVLALRVSTRIGTNPDDTKCAGPGGSHKSAVGLRLYYDSGSRPSRFDATITPDPNADLYLRSDGGPCPNGGGQSPGVTTRTLDRAVPAAASAKCKDSGVVNFANGNPFSLIGTWSLAPLP